MSSPRAPRLSHLRQLPCALLALWLAGPAHAQAGADCVPGGTVAQTNACAVKAFQQADTDNQILYGDVMRALSAHERPELRREQSEWARQRGAQCKKAQAVHEALPEWPRLYHECLTAATRQREAALKRWLHFGGPAQ